MNDEMVMMGGNGTKCKHQYWESAERFRSTSFWNQKRKQCLEFALPKPRRNLQTFGRCLQFKQSCPWASLSYFCTRKTSREINAMGPVILRKYVSVKLSIINPLWRRRNPCNLNPLKLLPKNHNLFCETGFKRGPEKKENLWPPAHNAKV